MSRQLEDTNHKPHTESRERQVLPTREECERLKNHRHYLWFKEGVKKNFLKRNKNENISQDELFLIFEGSCNDDLEGDVKLLLENGGMEDWQTFAAEPKKSATARGEIMTHKPLNLKGYREIDRKAVGAAEAGKVDYLDRDFMSPLLEKIFALPKAQRDKTEIDVNMLFYFLEGRGKVDVEWPVTMYDDKKVSKEDYLAEAKKLEEFFNSREKEPITEPTPSDPVATESETEKLWWEGQTFIQCDSGEEFYVVAVSATKNRIILKPVGKESPTLTLALDKLENDVNTLGSAWAKKSEEFPPSAELKREAKDWREIKREVEVDVVGDLHSNYAALKGNLETLGVSREISRGKFEWTGRNKKVKFIGDILGDRSNSGFETLFAIEDLKEQAKAAGGEVQDIAGNHDDFAAAFLMGRDVAGGGDPIENSQIGDQGLQLLEFSEFGSDELKNYDWSKFEYEKYEEKIINGNKELVPIYDPVWEMLRKDRGLILENMRNSEKGRKILEAICNMDIAGVEDDILYVHTDPEAHMVKSFLESERMPGRDIVETVRYFNKYYKENLRTVLLEGGETDKGFDHFSRVFLKTNNRTSFTNVEGRLEVYNKSLRGQGYTSQEIKFGEAEWRAGFELEAEDFKARLKAQGINAIIHGHTGVGDFRKNFNSSDFPIISSDLGAFKQSETSHSRSVIIVNMDGTIERGAVYRPDVDLALGYDKQVIEIRSK